VLTGLLYAAVIAMWAVVLIPRWLGTSDRYRDARTSKRFRRSLDAVSRRVHRSHDVAAMPGREPGRVDTAPADSAIDRHLDLGIDPFVGTAEDGHRRRAREHTARRKASAAAAVRRRRILVGLGGLFTLGLVGAVVGVVPMMWPVLLGATLGGYVFLLRNPSRLAGRAAPSAHPAAEPVADASPATTWEPRRAPEPSYMRAGRATAIPRELDSTTNGPWTAERMLEQAAALRTGEDPEAELGLDELAYPEYEPARAVNE
jgi:hypothetical protein